MAGEADTLILAHLHRIEMKLDAMQADVADLKHRMEALDYATVQLQSDMVAHHAGLSRQLDRVGGCLDRLERRLGIAPE